MGEIHRGTLVQMTKLRRERVNGIVATGVARRDMMIEEVG
jgi:hypothetical protein